jgi:hypothetical protein
MAVNTSRSGPPSIKTLSSVISLHFFVYNVPVRSSRMSETSRIARKLIASKQTSDKRRAKVERTMPIIMPSQNETHRETKRKREKEKVFPRNEGKI